MVSCLRRTPSALHLAYPAWHAGTVSTLASLHVRADMAKRADDLFPSVWWMIDGWCGFVRVMIPATVQAVGIHVCRSEATGRAWAGHDTDYLK